MRFHSIQYLRAVAAFMVVIYHLAGYIDVPGLTAESTNVLGSGVDIFFIISGFVMWVSTTETAVRPTDFWVARLIRIVPLYWLVTSVVTIMMLIYPSSVRTGRFDFGHVIASYLFTAWPHPTMQLMFPVLIPGWTLNYEMFFYVVFGLILLLPTGLRLPVLTASFLALTSTRLLWPEFGAIHAFYTDPILLEFVIGACLGHVVMTWAGRPAMSCLVLFVIGVILLVLLPQTLGTDQRLLVRGMPAAMMVGAAVLAERISGVPRFRLPELLGDASYSVYLVHPIALVALVKGWGGLGFDPHTMPVMSFVSALLVVAGAGILVHRGIELPLVSAARRLRPRRPEDRAAPELAHT